VKACRVGNSLQMAGATQIGIGAGDGGVLPDGERRKRLRERVAEVRILRRAAVARPPTGVDESCVRLVSRPNWFAPVALLLGRVRNWSRFTVSAPLEAR
jgi:hypothetical protein